MKLARRLLVAAFGVFSAMSLAQAQVATERLSVDSNGVEADEESYIPFFSADGRFALFASEASNLVPNDLDGVDDVFLRDRLLGLTTRVSLDSSGREPDGDCDADDLSADGRFVVFSSEATNLVGNDTNGAWDVFVRDLSTGVTERVSVDSSGAEGNDTSVRGSISDDGRFVSFQSFATNLVPNDGNGELDVFVHDRATGTTELVSVNSQGAPGDDVSYLARLSADGRFVAFESYADDLVAGDTNGESDVFLRDRTLAATTRVSVDSSGGEANDYCQGAFLSADARYVAFWSGATNLVAADSNGVCDVFVRDTVAGATTLVSVASDGTQGDDDSLLPFISRDGRFVSFLSLADNLVAGDTNGTYDAFVHHLATGTTTRASIASDGTGADDITQYVTISGTGEVVGFQSLADNLVQGDANGDYDAFAHVRPTDAASDASYGNGYAGSTGIPSLTVRAAPRLNTPVTLDVGNSRGIATFALLLVGATATNVPTGRGGDLLVVPTLVVPIALPAGGLALDGFVPPLESLAGQHAYLQAIEIDPGAGYGLSFSAGLDLKFGY